MSRLEMTGIGRGSSQDLKPRRGSSGARKPCLRPDYSWSRIDLGTKKLMLEIERKIGTLAFCKEKGSNTVWIVTVNKTRVPNRLHAISLDLRTGNINVLSQEKFLTLGDSFHNFRAEDLRSYKWDEKGAKPPIAQLKDFTSRLGLMLEESCRFGAFPDSAEIISAEKLFSALTGKYPF